MSQTPEEKRAYFRAWREKNRDKVNAYQREYAKTYIRPHELEVRLRIAEALKAEVRREHNALQEPLDE